MKQDKGKLFTDCRHLNKREVDFVFIDLKSFTLTSAKEINEYAKALMDDIQQNSIHRTMKFKDDQLTIQCIYPKFSKSIIDKIDTLIGKHYGYTPEELDFIINYDIKYRLGKNDDEN